MEPRYRVTIEPLTPEAQKNRGPEYRYSVSFRKLYGDFQGLAASYRTRGEVLAAFNAIKRDWEGRDYNLGRKGDKVTAANLQVVSKVNEITKEDLLGTPRMF